jgi:hypothetical protein
VEFIDLNEAVFVLIDLVKAVAQSETSLDKHFDQVVEDFVLRVFHQTLLLNVRHLLDVVCAVEVLELCILNDSVLVRVDLVEEGSNVIVTNGNEKASE